MTATPTASLQFQRAVRGLPFEAVYQFELDNDSPPDAAPTYIVANAEGTSVATGTATLTTSSPIEASFTLTAAELPERDFLTVVWSYTVSGQAIEVTSSIDVCDFRLFPITDFNQFNDAKVTSATAAQLEQARIDAENFLEEEMGRALTGRYGTEKWLLDRRGTRFGGGLGWGDYAAYGPWLRWGNSRTRLVLHRPYVQDIRSITRAWVDPETGETGIHTLDLNYFQLDPLTSTLHYIPDFADTFAGLWGELTIAYEHGQPLPDTRRICLILARYRIINGPLERRAQSMQLEGGGSIALLTPGQAASITGIPEVDRFINAYNARVDGFFGGLV